MSKDMMLDLIRRIKDDVEMQSSDTKFEITDLTDLANFEYEWVTKLNEIRSRKK